MPCLCTRTGTGKPVQEIEDFVKDFADSEYFFCGKTITFAHRYIPEIMKLIALFLSILAFAGAGVPEGRSRLLNEGWSFVRDSLAGAESPA